jgi:hypothetical protein
MANDRARDPKRVIDLDATRYNKRVNGRVQPIEASSTHKHEDEALALGNSGRKGPKLIAGPGWMGESDGK